MRIAHFSDPHLLSWDGARLRDFVNKRWIGGMNLIANRAREHKPAVFEAMVDDLNQREVDHFLCTGDVTNVALPGEFAFARSHFARLNHGPATTTVLPGNHDAYVEAGVPLFDRHFDDYCRADAEWRWNEGSRWPIVRVRGPVALVGVNTAHPTPWFNAWGEVGQGQLARLGQVLADGRLDGLLRLVAIHHPPAGRLAAHARHGLRDYEGFARVIAEAGAELVVHGHEHIDLREHLRGPGGASVPVRGIHSATYAGHRSSHRAHYRIFEIAQGAGSRPAVVAEQLFRLDLATGRFAATPSAS